MKPNRIKRHWADGAAVVNGWLSLPSAVGAEVMAHQGWDSLTIDLQHGLVDYAQALAMLQALSTTEVVPLARVPWLEPGVIMKVLDAGAYGVICPMIDGPEEAAALVSYLRYPPQGHRSFGPTRAVFSAGDDYAARANDELVCLAMIETAAAVDRVEEIVAVPGLDGVYIGPADLSLALGYAPGMDRTEPELRAAIERILRAAHDRGRVAGIHTLSPAYARQMIEIGFDLVTVSNDVRLLAGAARATVAAVKRPPAGEG